MAFERFARLQQLLYGLPFCGFNSDSIRFERCAQIRSGKRPMRRPLFTEINAYSDIVENAPLVLEWPQGATVQQASRNGLKSAPAVQTAVGFNCQFS
jgi:hypothetical protein